MMTPRDGRLGGWRGQEHGRTAREAHRKEGRGGRQGDDHRGYIFPNPGHESESSAFPSFHGGKNWPFHMMIRGEGGCPCWVGWTARAVVVDSRRWVPWVCFQPVMRGNSGGEQEYRHVLLFLVDFSQVMSNVPAVVGSLVQRPWALLRGSDPGRGVAGYTSIV